MEDTFKHKGLREKLVDGIREKGIKNNAVLSAMSRVPRHLFMDNGFINFAYSDRAFPIGAGQTISQPYTVAFQTDCLQLKRFAKVLEVGTGSGYQAAVLCELGVTLYTIERQRELYEKAQKLLPSLGYHPQFFFGDGYKGLPTYGPFDGIIVTAGATTIPQDLVKQLVVGGRMVIPVGTTQHQVMKVVIRESENEYSVEERGDFLFVPMLPGVAGQNR
ncbi:MAG: protein-L-isoaspartate(D-aspartate) O-methyltransferase [Marinilabiliales bacterium]|nr:protein-L-isoaspartate(D-aspartate) O-methyltransferase [Marinilabiliales bacterium]